MPTHLRPTPRTQRFPARRRPPAIRCWSAAPASGATCCSSRSDRAEWAWSTRPTIPSSTGRSRSSCCAPAADNSEAQRERLLREAQALARLAHPNVLAVHDVGTFGGDVFIAMEFIEGDDAAQLARRAGSQPARDPRGVPRRGRWAGGGASRRAGASRLQARQRDGRQATGACACSTSASPAPLRPAAMRASPCLRRPAIARRRTRRQSRLATASAPSVSDRSRARRRRQLRPLRGPHRRRTLGDAIRRAIRRPTCCPRH